MAEGNTGYDETDRNGDLQRVAAGWVQKEFNRFKQGPRRLYRADVRSADFHRSGKRLLQGRRARRLAGEMRLEKLQGCPGTRRIRYHPSPRDVFPETDRAGIGCQVYRRDP